MLPARHLKWEKHKDNRDRRNEGRKIRVGPWCRCRMTCCHFLVNCINTLAYWFKEASSKTLVVLLGFVCSAGVLVWDLESKVFVVLFPNTYNPQHQHVTPPIVFLKIPLNIHLSLVLLRKQPPCLWSMCLVELSECSHVVIAVIPVGSELKLALTDLPSLWYFHPCKLHFKTQMQFISWGFSNCVCFVGSLIHS